MASFLSKLARLPPLPGLKPVPAPPPEPDPAASPPERTIERDAEPLWAKPLAPPPPPPRTLDELRDRIARIIARSPTPTPRADPARGELPFLLEHTEHGARYVYRVR